MVGLPALAHAYVVGISSTTKNLYLQVGQGSVKGGSVNSGGTPGNNSAVNVVSATVAATALGSGAPQPMTPDVAVTTSYIDNASYCLSTDTYIGGMYRGPNTAASSATLSAVAQATGLVNASGDTISFNTISWVTQTRNGDGAVMASGSFSGNGTTQTIWSIARNNWAESCLQFNYANAQVVPAGTYKGRVTYTLSAP